MAERLQAPQPGSLPPIKNFVKFINASPNEAISANPFKFWAVRLHDFISKDDIIAKEFPEEGLNELYLFWHSFSKKENHVSRLLASTNNPAIPALELKEALGIAQNKNALITEIGSSIKTFVADEQAEWGIAEKAMQSVTQYNEVSDVSIEEQIIALFEAIAINATEKPLDPVRMRQLIAQHAFTELFEEGVPYAALYFNTEYEDPTTMRDPLEVEKNELVGTLNNEPWDSKTRAKKERTYNRLVKELKRNRGYDASDDLIKEFHALWDYTKGEIPPRTSAIKILKMQQDIFEAFTSEGLFETELGTQSEE
jgi:hypothetical protein